MRKPDAPANSRPWWTLCVVLLLAPFYFLAAHLGYEDRFYVACMFAAAIGVAAWVHWKSRRHLAFWIAALVLVVVHIALVMLLPWSTWKPSGAAFTPVGYLDFFVNLAVIRWALLATSRFGREGRAP